MIEFLTNLAAASWALRWWIVLIAVAVLVAALVEANGTARRLLADLDDADTDNLDLHLRLQDAENELEIRNEQARARVEFLDRRRAFTAGIRGHALDLLPVAAWDAAAPLDSVTGSGKGKPNPVTAPSHTPVVRS